MQRIIKILLLLIFVNLVSLMKAQEFSYNNWRNSFYNRDIGFKCLELFIEDNKLLTFQKPDSIIKIDFSVEVPITDSICFFDGKIARTDSLPKEIGMLTNLYYIGIYNENNSLFIPKEIGNLKKLEYLGIRSNFKNGNLPAEIGS